MIKKHKFKKDRKSKKKIYNFFGAVKRFFHKLFQNNRNKNTFEGVVEVFSSGVILVKIENNKNIFIQKQYSQNALNGDTVIVKLLDEKSKFGETCGQIIDIIKRKNVFFVGTVVFVDDFSFLDVSDRKIFYPIKLLKNDKSIDKHRVKVKVFEYPTEKNQFFLCKVVEVFGIAGTHEAEMNTIIAEYNLNKNFDKELLQKVDRISISVDKELKNRKDYRNVFTVTIDPENSKDFDDALSIKKLENEHFEIGVHIADVSYFVREKTPLDKEAYDRSTSVYLVDRVIPMLPERLCNDLCSLIPNKDRLTMSIIFEIDKSGKIFNEWIGETIINSNKRMTYEEAQQGIENSEHEFHEVLSVLNEIAQSLRNERIQNGAINFEFEDVNFSVDCENNLVMDNTKCEESHHLVEEFMLLANKRIAEYVHNISKDNIHKPVFIYRIHDYPDIQKIHEFSRQIKKFGITINEDIDTFSSSLNNMLLEIKDSPNKNILSTLAVRTMQRAEYTIEPRGHYGLAFKHYTHFTSPIRRYVDITVHRLLKKYLHGDYCYNKEYYDDICRHANEQELIATDVERESIKFKLTEMLKNHIGEKCVGTVSGLAEFGIFVELNEYKCDGLIRFAEYKDDYFVLDRVNSRVFGKYTGNTYEVGDLLNVVIKDCDVEKRLIDLMFV